MIQQRYEQEMSISHQEFYRLLPLALKNADFVIDNNQINVSYGGGSILIKPGNEDKRKIASLVLPVLHVAFVFTAIPAADVTQFLTDFSRVYHRGGG